MTGAMVRLVSRFLVDCLALWVAVRFVPGIHSPEGFVSLVSILFLFGIANALVRPFLFLMALPLILVTVCPILLFLNTLLILLCALLSKSFGLGFTVDGWIPAMAGAVIASAVRVMILAIAITGKRAFVYMKEEILSRKLEKSRKSLEEQIAELRQVVQERE